MRTNSYGASRLVWWLPSRTTTRAFPCLPCSMFLLLNCSHEPLPKISATSWAHTLVATAQVEKTAAANCLVLDTKISLLLVQSLRKISSSTKRYHLVGYVSFELKAVTAPCAMAVVRAACDRQLERRKKRKERILLGLNSACSRPQSAWLQVHRPTKISTSEGIDQPLTCRGQSRQWRGGTALI